MQSALGFCLLLLLLPRHPLPQPPCLGSGVSIPAFLLRFQVPPSGPLCPRPTSTTPPPRPQLAVDFCLQRKLPGSSGPQSLLCPPLRLPRLAQGSASSRVPLRLGFHSDQQSDCTNPGALPLLPLAQADLSKASGLGQRFPGPWPRGVQRAREAGYVSEFLPPPTPAGGTRGDPKGARRARGGGGWGSRRLRARRRPALLDVHLMPAQRGPRGSLCFAVGQYSFFITLRQVSHHLFFKIFTVAVLGLSLAHRIFTAVQGLSSVACRLSCPGAYEILVPRPGIKPASPALEDRFLTTGPPGKSPTLVLCYVTFSCLCTCCSIACLPNK